jgi:hypothetical protein
MLRTVVLPPHPQPLSQRARGARKTFKVPRPQGEGFRERETPGFELDKVYVPFCRGDRLRRQDSYISSSPKGEGLPFRLPFTFWEEGQGDVELYFSRRVDEAVARFALLSRCGVHGIPVNHGFYWFNVA